MPTDIVDQPVREHTLTHRDEDGGAKELKEEHQRRGDGDFRGVEDRLNGNLGLLETETDTEADDDLVSDPFGVTGLHIPGHQEARANGRQRGTGEHEGGVVANLADESTGENGCYDCRDQERDVANAGLIRADALDGLEPDGEVVDCDEKGRAHAEGEDACGPDAPFLHHVRIYRCGLRSPELDANEDEDADAKDNEESDDAAT